MDSLDATVGLAGALALSVAAYAAMRRAQRRGRQTGAAPDDDPLADAFAKLGLLDAEPAAPRGAATVRARRVTLDRRARTARPSGSGPRAAGAPAAPGAAAEMLSHVGTLQWDRALAALESLDADARDRVAAEAETLALERMRALPDSDLLLGVGGWRFLAALDPDNAPYAERLAQGLAALGERRAALMDRLTQDEDRREPGTVWLNHPWNPRFDDTRRPIWPYIGCRPDGRPVLRLRTNWLGDMRISVRGLEVVHDGMAETLTDGSYKIDPDALGWEWRDEAADMYQIEVLRSLVGAGEVTLRYKGDPWPCETPLTEEEKRDVGEMLELFDLLAVAAPPRQSLAA